MTGISFIFLRVLASPVVNVFQKKLMGREWSPEFLVFLSYLFFAVLAVPVFIVLKPVDLPGQFWVYIVLLGIFDFFGNLFLVRSLRYIDLSIFGPLNAYKPVFAMVTGVFIVGEIPTPGGVGGVLIIIAGSYLLNYAKGKSSVRHQMKFYTSKGTAFRFLAILLTAIAAVFSKKTILLGSPLITLVYWSFIGAPLSFVAWKIGKKSRDGFKRLPASAMPLAGLLLSFLVLQLATLFTFQHVFVGYSLAFFQLSALVSVFFGYHFFKERQIRYRLAGAIVMVIGAVIIVVLG